MNETTGRGLLYGGAALALAALAAAYGWAERDADVMTLLSSADVQLRLAHGMPAVDKDGQDLSARTAMIVDAEKNLDVIDRLQPQMAVATEFRGFARMLRNDFVGAAAHYAAAQACPDCGEEQRAVLAFNQARMLAKAGSGEQALVVFRRHGAEFDRRWPGQRGIEEAQVLRQLGRDQEAVATLEQMLAVVGEQPMAWLQAGCEFEQLAQPARAEQSWQKVAAQVPVANYFLARLKLRLGNVDSSCQWLERAANAAPAEVRRRVREEPEAWKALAGEARFQRLLAATPATPGR